MARESLFDNRYRYDYIYPRGRSGEALRAYDTQQDERLVVIKRPAPNDAPPIRAGQEVSILNERKALNRLAGHPVLTELLGSGQFHVGGTMQQYIVVERAQGEIIADAVEYMVNAHCADAIVCISNCDKITPGMLNAAMRLNIPAVFVSGGPMESGKAIIDGQEVHLDLVDAMVSAANPNESDEDVMTMERSACPTCGSCSGMFTANSMNCLTEALGLSLPGNGSTLATHADRRELFLRAGRLAVDIARRYYEQDDESVLPRSIATFEAFENAMSLDIAMGGSTNTILHLLAAAQYFAISTPALACRAAITRSTVPVMGSRIRLASAITASG